jgi:hypothetical protein
MRANPNWGTNLGGWVKPFRLSDSDRARLKKLTSADTMEKLETATRRFIAMRKSEGREPCNGELRAALLRLRKWAAMGRDVLPNHDELLGTDLLSNTLYLDGWDLERWASFRREVEVIQSAADTVLSQMKPRRGNPRKGARIGFAHHIASILENQGFKPTSTKFSIFWTTLETLLSATKDPHDAHRLVEQTIKERKNPPA